MESRPPAEGDPGTSPSGQPPYQGAPGQPPNQGQPPYQGAPGQPPNQGQPPYQGAPGQPPNQGQPPYQGAPGQPGPPPYPGQPYGGMPPYPGPGGMQPGPYRRELRKTSVPAQLALAFSIIGGLGISVVLAIVALARIPSRNQKGKGLAIAALIISGAWVVLIGLVVVFSDGGEPDRDAAGQVIATQNTKPEKLRVGDCVSEIKEGEVLNIKVQPCDQPNGGRVFAVFELPAGDWPGLTDVQAAAEKGCTDRWKASKEQADESSSIFYLHPTENGWQLGDRGTTCLLAPN